MGTTVVPHNMKFAFRILIQNLKKTQKSSFFVWIYFRMAPTVVPKVLESKSMMFQVPKTVSTVINEHLDKILQILEFC